MELRKASDMSKTKIMRPSIEAIAIIIRREWMTETGK